jgi:hypothetical protein
VLFEIVNTKWDEVEPVEMCPTTSTTSADHQASTLREEEEGKRSKGGSPLEEVVKLPLGAV